MPNAFDASNPPFDRLTSQEVETLRAALDIAYFRPGQTIIAQNAPADALFVVIKGTIEERDGSDLLALLGPKDSFDSRALVHGKSGHAFLAREETLCYLAPKGVTLGLIQNNPRFASFFYREISHKLDELVRDEEERRFGSLMRARVTEQVPVPERHVRHGGGRRSALLHHRGAVLRRHLDGLRYRCNARPLHHHRHEPVQGGGAATPGD